MAPLSIDRPDPSVSAPVIEPKIFRHALGAFATGVTIVTTRGEDGGDVGLTANSFSSVSLNPPMVLWSLAKTSSSIDAFRQAGHFAVHILAADQDALSGRFASKGIDKFAGLDIGRGHDDIPMLHDCTARFECRTTYQYEGGDHVIFVGEVLDFTHSERSPLIFHGGRYGMVIGKDPMQTTSAGAGGSGLSSDDLIFHISRAFFQIRHDAVAERRRRGWTEHEYAALSVLGREDEKTVGEINALSVFPGRHVTPEVIIGLAARGLVSVSLPVEADSAVRLTPLGRQSIVEIIAIIKASEADALQEFDFSEIQMLRQLLCRLSNRGAPGWPPFLQQERLSGGC
jgi:3-hydroxy-9,10-secoandrosta-1,3,5(10)-triene-9,17-dione monooxygenase reductase component